MDANHETPKATGSLAKLYDRATSTIIGAIEPILRRPNGPGLAAPFTLPAPPASTTAPARFRKTRCAAPPVDLRGRPHPSRRTLLRHLDHRGLARPGARGFFAVGARQSGSRDPTKTDYTSHLIRLRRLDDARHTGSATPSARSSCGTPMTEPAPTS